MGERKLARAARGQQQNRYSCNCGEIRRQRHAPHHGSVAPIVVVIEEDELLRSLLAEWLNGAGYTVREATLDAPTAGDNADLVIVDLFMPRYEGADVVRRVQRRHPHATIVATSARFDAGVRHSWRAARELGAWRLIAKPFSREELLGTVRAAVGRAR
jgi:DNA-binding response OmpR family regulator